MKNIEHYFGTPEAAARMEVVWHSWPFRIVVGRVAVDRAWSASRCTSCHQRIADFDSEGAYRAWLDAEHDDGTVSFEG